MFQEWLLVRRRQWLLFCPLLGTSPLLTLQSVEPRPFFQVLCTVKRPTLYCLLALLALLTPLRLGQLKTCYYDVGSPADDLPCDPAANVSTCCGGQLLLCRRLLLYQQGWQLGCRKLYRQEMARSSLSPTTRPRWFLQLHTQHYQLPRSARIRTIKPVVSMDKEFRR